MEKQTPVPKSEQNFKIDESEQRGYRNVGLGSAAVAAGSGAAFGAIGELMRERSEQNLEGANEIIEEVKEDVQEGLIAFVNENGEVSITDIESGAVVRGETFEEFIAIQEQPAEDALDTAEAAYGAGAGMGLIALAGIGFAANAERKRRQVSKQRTDLYPDNK